MNVLKKQKVKQIDWVQDERKQLYQCICAARAEWDRANLRFQEALGEDEVDYAIYILEAAEKKYDMLIRQAKRIQLNVLALRV